MTDEQFDALGKRLDGLDKAVEALRSESEANFRSVKAQLGTLEYGVLTIAQKLLAEAEVRDIQTKMMRRVAG